MISRLLTDLLFEQFRDGIFLLFWRSTFLILEFLHVDLVHNGLLVTHLRHLLVSILECVNKQVNPLVQLVKIHLHIFFLGLKVFRFFIGIEVFKLLVLLNRLLLGLVCGDSRPIFLLLVLLLHVSSGVGVLLDHEAESSLKGASLDVLGSLREQFAKILQLCL